MTGFIRDVRRDCVQLMWRSIERRQVPDYGVDVAPWFQPVAQPQYIRNGKHTKAQQSPRETGKARWTDDT
jgi:hypothetical protein